MRDAAARFQFWRGARESTDMTPRAAIAKPALLVIATIVLAWLVLARVEAINGSRFHRWGWWTPPLPALKLFSAMLAAMIPFAVAMLWFERSKRAAPALILVALATLLLQLAVISAQPGALDRIPAIVAHDWTTSYFTDARALQHIPARQWIQEFHKLLPGFHLHSREKPPGPILYWWTFLQIFDSPRRAAIAGGIVQILVASLIVPASYWLAKVVTRDRRAAFLAACWTAIIPAVILLAPSFDQWYPLLACGIVGTWIRALETRRISWAAACGAVLSIAVFFSYSMLTLGALMALLGIRAMMTCPQTNGAQTKGDTTLYPSKGSCPLYWSVAIQSSVVMGVVIVLYAAMQLLSEFDPLATFAQAWKNQREWEAQFAIPRAHPATIPSDLQDFFLGSAWISALLIIFWLVALRRNRNDRTIIVLLCLIQPMIVAATGLLQCETARVWSIMQPLALIPVGTELSRWTGRARLTAFVCLFILLAVQARSFIFQY